MGGGRNRTVTHWGRVEGPATSSLHWDRLEVSVRSISTTVLTFFHLTSFISVFVGSLEAPWRVQSDVGTRSPTRARCETAACESADILPRTWPKRGRGCHTVDFHSNGPDGRTAMYFPNQFQQQRRRCWMVGAQVGVKSVAAPDKDLLFEALEVRNVLIQMCLLAFPCRDTKETWKGIKICSLMEVQRKWS